MVVPANKCGAFVVNSGGTAINAQTHAKRVPYIRRYAVIEIADPELTKNPNAITACIRVDAIPHCVEALAARSMTQYYRVQRW